MAKKRNKRRHLRSPSGPNPKAQELISSVYRGQGSAGHAPSRTPTTITTTTTTARRDGSGDDNSQEVAWIRRFVRRHEPLARFYRVLKRACVWCVRRSIITWLIGPALATLAVRILLAVIEIPVSGFRNETIANLLIFALTVVIVQLIRLSMLGSWLRLLLQIDGITKEQNKPFLEKLATARLVEIRDTIQALVQGDFKPDPPESMAAYFANFFDQGGDWYIGVDSHLPTHFLSQYDWYLKVHESFLQRNRQDGAGRLGTRILIASRNDLTNDYLRDPQRYLEFVRWHHRNRVELFWIDLEKAQRIRAKFSIPDSTDLGLWANYAVAFIYDDTSVPCLTMRFPADEVDTLSWSNCEGFVEAIASGAELLKEGPPGLEVVDEDLAKAWEAYVDSSARMDRRGKFATFVLDVLSGKRLVFDAATGIGCESVLLLKHGFSVVSNEVDANLAAVAEGFAAQRDVRIDLRNFLWEELAARLPGHMQFDAILCLGNSLCLVDTEERRRDALQSFFAILSPGGELIIDERNFSFMLTHRDEIVSSPLSYPPVRGDVMYAGESVRGVPVAIDDDRISWRLFNRAGVRSRDDVLRNARGSKELFLYPFEYGELLSMLATVGFEGVQVFADLEPTGRVDEMPPYSEVEHVHFFTYVARKPH